ncbi:MAG: exodeoxyribonuclease V subunit gamma, partial [Proteobacteria bacterium]|nr:exodeoxyribonuclease V subunit gamma [Pseudomonadota bacterium]
MSGFYLHTSNDQEELVSILAGVIGKPLADPLAPEIVVVQSLGMKRWIFLQLAGRLGILSNTDFRFPNQILMDVFEQVVPDFREKRLFERKRTVWRIMELLPGCLDNPDFEQLKNYLVEDGKVRQVKSYQLALRIANLFDQYCMYRPEMILAWDEGRQEGWQSEVWRLLGNNRSDIHLPGLRKAFFENLETAVVRGVALPERICVFGITSLPPLYIEMFTWISRHMDVNLFFLNPSREYWSDISSDKETARRFAREKDDGLTEDDLYLEKGNSLLASLGGTGQNFFQQLMETEYIDPAGGERFKNPGEGSVLKSIQSDIFHLRDRGTEDCPTTAVSMDDRSLQIHSCHSRMREVEVLHDQLLSMMDRDTELKPGHILVMAPDIDPYVSIIKAVFSAADDGGRNFPFSIADRSYSQESHVVQYFLKLLELPGSRFTVSKILDLLESEAVLSKFDLQPGDLDSIRHWIESSNIRWGIDGSHRQSLGLPSVYENTWEFGLDRILLGVAMPDTDGSVFEGILPYDDIEGSGALVLGNFLELFSRLKALIRPQENNPTGLKDPFSHLRMDTPRSLSEWGNYFNTLIACFFGLDESWETEMQMLRDVFGEMSEIEETTGVGGQIEFEVVRDHLTECLEGGSVGFGFLGSGITFCSMLPMRSIPFKVIVLLGMNEQEFPRLAKPLSFDLIAKNPRLGDRSQKDDDRYLFLEAVLSA